MGRPLAEITQDFPRLAAQLEETRRDKELFAFRAWWKMMQNLQLPPSSDASKPLEGEGLNLPDDERQVWHRAHENFVIGEQLLFFGLHEERVERLLGVEQGNTYSEGVPGYLPGPIDTFHRGIVWYAMARRKGKRRYKVEANKIRAWTRLAKPNILHVPNVDVLMVLTGLY